MSISTDLKDDELSIGKLIRKKRKEKGYTQQTLADELNVSPQAVSKWERDKCDPDKQQWLKLSKLLDIPKERFAGLYEVSEEGQDEIPPGVIAALKTFFDALGVMKSNMWGGKNNDRDSDDRTDS